MIRLYFEETPRWGEYETTLIECFFHVKK